jgi:hypothetical protein
MHALRCLRLCSRSVRRSQPALLGGGAALLQLHNSRLRRRCVASLRRHSGLSVSGEAFQGIDALRVLLHVTQAPLQHVCARALRQSALAQTVRLLQDLPLHLRLQARPTDGQLLRCCGARGCGLTM